MKRITEATSRRPATKRVCPDCGDLYHEDRQDECDACRETRWCEYCGERPARADAERCVQCDETCPRCGEAGALVTTADGGRLCRSCAAPCGGCGLRDGGCRCDG